MHPVRATSADRDAVIGTVVAAFATDPAFRYFFPDDDAYPEQAAAFAAWLFDKRVERGSVWIVDGGVSVAMWDPPGPWGPTKPLEIPKDALARLASYDEAVHRELPKTAHWYLGVLATHPDHAGQRLGRQALRPGLEAARDAGLPAYLETTTSANEGIYQRAGWRTVASVTVGAFLVRVMRHDPAQDMADGGTTY
jgi:GNAT superfamily N-acetyltransferase